MKVYDLGRQKSDKAETCGLSEDNYHQSPRIFFFFLTTHLLAKLIKSEYCQASKFLFTGFFCVYIFLTLLFPTGLVPVGKG